jgi:regulation of enolase protein 1 (concanavalin A-like superfamily)
MQSDYRSSFGFRGDYTGLGLYVFKHEKQWRILGIYNQGLAGMSVASAVANLTQPDNSCVLYDFDGGSIDFKYRVNKQKLTVEYSLDNGKKYQPCITEKSYYGFYAKGYVGISAGNPYL